MVKKEDKMTASRKDVDRWIKTAKEEQCKYIISMCDDWDYSDYPIYCEDKDTLILKYTRLGNKSNMQRVNEIIRIEDDGTVTENLKIENI